MPEDNDQAEEVRRLRRQRSVLARFGSHALGCEDLDTLLGEAAELVSEALEIHLVKVLEFMPDGETLLIRAGVNWRPGVVGHATISAHLGSPAGYALHTGQPVVSPDIALEKRFTIPAILVEHGVKGIINVVIKGEGPAWGVLEVDTPRPRGFDDDDIGFLQNYANLLAAAIDRHRTHRELADALERGRMLQSELHHRESNLLSNVRALARRSRATSLDLESFAEALDARFGALGRAQELLRGGTTAVDLGATVLQELEAHGAQPGERVTVEGPEVALPGPAAQALAMAFHELATNASKYGALGRDGGRLRVSWTEVNGENGERELLIRWRETGLVIAAPPERRGFGSQTVERNLPFMLGGSSELLFHPDGVECVIRFPKPELDGGPDDSAF